MERDFTLIAYKKLLESAIAAGLDTTLEAAAGDGVAAAARVRPAQSAAVHGRRTDLSGALQNGRPRHAAVSRRAGRATADCLQRGRCGAVLAAVGR